MFGILSTFYLFFFGEGEIMKARIKLVTLYLLLIINIICGSFSVYAVPNVRFDNPNGVGEILPIGVYIYKGDGEYWNPIIIEAHFRSLSHLGINLIHTDSVSFDSNDNGEILDIADKYGIKIIYQIGSAYFSNPDENTGQSYSENKITTAINKIEKFISHPALLSFSVREEPALSYIAGTGQPYTSLMEYYRSIRDGAVNQGIVSSPEELPMTLIHNDSKAMQAVYDYSYSDGTLVDNYLPSITGADRYKFFWEFAPVGEYFGFLNTPFAAFRQYNSETMGWPAFRNKSLNNQAFYGVITGNCGRKEISIANLQKKAIGKGCSEEGIYAGECDLYNRLIRLAETNNQGLSLDLNTNTLKYWKYYRPPQNAMSAQTWMTIAYGAHGIMSWSAQPKKSTSASWSGLMGDDGKGHRTLYEYTQAANEIAPFGWMINRMQLEPSLPSISTGFIDQPDNKQNMLINKTFSVKGFSGHVVMLVNTFVGTWSGGKTNYMLAKVYPYHTTDDSFHITEDGELSYEDYSARTIPDAVGIDMSNLQAGYSVYDLHTGLAINSATPLTIQPGKGRFLFIGSESEFELLQEKIGLTSTIPLLGRSEIGTDHAEHKRLVYPVDPIVLNSEQNNFNFNISNESCYRVHLTASSENEADIEAAITYFENTASPSKKIDLFQTAINGTMEIVSQNICLGDYDTVFANLQLTQLNSSGAITLHDVWLEDTTAWTRFSKYYHINFSAPKLSPDTEYKLYVEAKELDDEETTLGVRYLAFNSSNEVVKTGNIISWGSHLTNEFQKFSSESFQINGSDIAYFRIGFYKANYHANEDNTLVIKRAWVEKNID